MKLFPSKHLRIPNNRYYYASEAISLGFFLVLDLYERMDVTKRS